MVNDVEIVDAIGNLISEIESSMGEDGVWGKTLEDLDAIRKRIDVVTIVMPRYQYKIIDNYIQVNQLSRYVEDAWDSASVKDGA